MQAVLERTGSAPRSGDCGAWGQCGSSFWGVFSPSPLRPEATISLDHLGANTAGAPLSAVVKCRSNFVLQFKELKKQGVGRGVCLTSHHTLPPPTALLVSRAILHRLHEASRSLQILQPELGC